MALRRYYPFAHELGEIPLEDASATVSATLAATWGGWTAASAATVHTPIEAVLAATWGAWTASMTTLVHTTVSATLAATWGSMTGALTATVIPRIEASLAADWGAWDAQMSAIATSAPVTNAVLAATWGGWTAALAATVTPRIESVLEAAWGGWDAQMSATGFTTIDALLATTWGAWTGALAATVIPRIEASLAATWGGWTGASTATVIPRIESVLTATWGGWTAAMAATVQVSVSAVLTATWGGWTAVSVAVVTPMTVELVAAWGGWYAHSFGRPHTPPRTSALVPYTLGCGIYEAYFKTRGGYTFVGRATNITALKWSRVLNDVSEAEVTFALNGIEGGCCDLAAAINPWEHELSIYRDGEEVWCGPVTGGKIDLNEGMATFNARDLMSWFDHRWVEVADNEVEFDEVDITILFDWLLSHGYWKDPFNLDWFIGEPLGVPITRTYVEYVAPDRWGGVYQNIATELRDLVNAKIDFTTIRRVMLAGNLQTGTQAAPIQLLDRDWSKLPDITIDGSSMATEQAVAGSAGGNSGYDDDQMWIERPNDADRVQFGLLQSLDSAPELDDIDTYDLPNPISQRAYELREIRKRPFTYLSGGVISRHAPVTFDQLIPGRHFRIVIDQACRTVRSNYLLTRTDTSFGEEGEEVTLELVPPGIDMLKGS